MYVCCHCYIYICLLSFGYKIILFAFVYVDKFSKVIFYDKDGEGIYVFCTVRDQASLIFVLLTSVSVQCMLTTCVINKKKSKVSLNNEKIRGSSFII